MEELNRKLAERLERSEQQSEKLRREQDAQIRKLTATVNALSSKLPNNPARAEVDRSLNPASLPQVPALPTPTIPAIEEAPPIEESEAGPMADVADAVQTPEYNGPVPEYETQPIEPNPFRTRAPGLSTILAPPRIPALVSFGPGFQLHTPDDEFLLQVHIQSQIEARVWGDASSGTPYQNGFFLPRQRIFFNGRITKPIEYVFSINRGFGELNILETFLNFHFDDRLQVRFGRYFTPLGYDQFAIRNLWLPTPERSLFTTNLGTNRQVGLMAWGFLFDKRLDYAVGLFSGPRNSFEDFNNSKDITSYINARPFQGSERFAFLRDLNVGTSVAYGSQDQPAVPQAFRIGAVAPTNSSQSALATAPFLTLNNNVLERGQRLLGSVHGAYFYKGLSLIGEWNYGYGTYATAGAPVGVQVPISAYYVTGAYFLTGEHVDRRAMVVPLRPLVPSRPGQVRGIGAWEAVGRVSELGLGQQIFEKGLADPALWTNSVTTTELGMNWYWNEYLKVYLFWLHGQYGSPVTYASGDVQNHVDMLWMRFQLYY